MVLMLACTLAPAADIRILASDIEHFIGTYDPDQGTLIDYKIVDWDDSDPMSYPNAIKQFPDEESVYYGMPPWYSTMATAVLPVPEQGVTFVALMDIKLQYSTDAKISRWRMDGDYLVFECIGENFPRLGGAPNLDGSFLFPDNSRFIVARSAGGDMSEVWHAYAFIHEAGDCTWVPIYSLRSRRDLASPNVVETYCRMVDPGNSYDIVVVEQEFKDANASNAKPISVDSAYINLWEMAQQGKR